MREEDTGDYGKFARERIEEIGETVGEGTAVSALSGGVDSAVATVLGHKAIGKRLKGRDIHPWLDEWELPPGRPWQPLLEEQIGQIRSAAVFVGENGIGPWQDMELNAFLRQFVSKSCPVIPVILPECEETPELPIFLSGMT